MMTINKAAVAVVGAAIAVTGFIGAVFLFGDKVQNEPDASEPVTTTYARPTQTAPEQTDGEKKFKFRENMEVVLVMGIDDTEKRPDDNEYVHSSQADVLYVIAIDHKNKTFQTLQINRETVTEVKQIIGAGEEDVVEMQVCLAHSYGRTENARCLNVCESVSGLICDVPIDHYISLNMSSISVINEQVGGVTVTVPAGLEKVDPEFKEGAQVTLKGKQAELFVRSRMSLDNDSNIFRMQRQEIFMKAWKQQAYTKMTEESGFAAKFVLALSEYMASDMTASRLSELANTLKEYKDLGTLTPEGETLEPGEGRLFREFHVNEEDMRKKVLEIFYEEA